MKVSRRGFLALASGLLVPEPVRAYSFVGGWARHPFRINCGCRSCAGAVPESVTFAVVTQAEMQAHLRARIVEWERRGIVTLTAKHGLDFGDLVTLLDVR